MLGGKQISNIVKENKVKSITMIRPQQAIVPQQVSMPLGIVTIGTRSWVCYVATTAEQLSAGLGSIESIPANTGMIFVMSYPRIVRVTTYPMLLNLDIIFLDESFNVVQIERDIEPSNFIDSVPNVKYFIEVNSGETGDGVDPTSMQLGEVATIEYESIPEPTPALSGFQIGSIISLAAIGGIFAWVTKSMSKNSRK